MIKWSATWRTTKTVNCDYLFQLNDLQSMCFLKIYGSKKFLGVIFSLLLPCCGIGRGPARCDYIASVLRMVHVFLSDDFDSTSL